MKYIIDPQQQQEFLESNMVNRTIASIKLMHDDEHSDVPVLKITFKDQGILYIISKFGEWDELSIGEYPNYFDFKIDDSNTPGGKWLQSVFNEWMNNRQQS